ncbi:hypothetical protein TeGR_g11583 [Tetraparma gracilis]|uniref:G domain-containing protein n=1 Tax=Tetraparma gracilis TaxID=2962635 RepID=A0ABQ6MQN3_9STRA|nr:hypothetical protein TeGR_g11583 [Tetraparma gracilis]
MFSPLLRSSLRSSPLRAASALRCASSTPPPNPPGKKPKPSKIQINPNWETEFDSAGMAADLDALYGFAGKAVESNRVGRFQATRLETPLPGDAAEDDVAEDDGGYDGAFPEFLDEDELDFEGAALTDTSGVAGGMEERLAAAQDASARGFLTSASDADYIDGLSPGAAGGRAKPEEKSVYALRRDVPAGTCPGCGVGFQASDEGRVGFLPRKQMDVVDRMVEAAGAKEREGREWTTEEEVDFLLAQRAAELGVAVPDVVGSPAGGAEPEPFRPPSKPITCKRCFDLQNGNIGLTISSSVAPNPDPSTTPDPYLSRDSFVSLLTASLAEHAGTSIILILVDLWDFGPAGALEPLDAILRSLPEPPPVLLAVNKADLFPPQLSALRSETWVRRELEYHGIGCVKGVKGDVRLISGKTGFGVKSLVAKVLGVLEDEGRSNVFVCGGANVGKSTLLNRLIEDSAGRGGRKVKRKAGNANKRSANAVTVSPLPGTTLGVMKMRLGEDSTLMDTPGLLVDGSLNRLLTGEEMKLATPKKTSPITLRVEPGSSVLIGGLARVDVKDDCKAFMVTVWVSSEIKLHMTKTAKADEVLRKHLGTMLTPPIVEVAEGEDREEKVRQRLEQLGDMVDHPYEIEGKGWKESAADITLRGLGWVSIVGAGTASINVRVPKGVGVDVRPPLMPFDHWQYTGKFTGGRAINRTGYTKGKKKTKRAVVPRSK